VTELDGEVPPGWQTTTLGSVGKWGSGGTPRRGVGAYFGGSIPWLKIGDLTDGIVTESEETITQEGLENSSAKLVDPGTLLVAMYGSIGKLGIPAMTCATNQAIAFCTPDPTVTTSKFLFQLLLHLRPTLVGEGKGGNQSNISQTVLKALAVPLPSLDEQERLVQCLEFSASSALSATSHLATAARAIERFHQAVLTAACSGRLTGDWRKRFSGPKARPLARNTSVRRRRASVEVSLPWPELPGDWVLARVSEISELVTDGDHNPPRRTSSGIPHLTARNVRGGKLTLENCTFLAPNDFDRVRRRYDPHEGDVIITCVGTLGSTAVVPAGFTFSADRNLAVIRPKRGVHPDYLRLVLDSPIVQMHIRDASGSTSQPHLYLGALREIPIPVAPAEEQVEIVRQVADLIAHADSLRDRIDAANTTIVRGAQAVLAKAFRGDLAAPLERPVNEQ